MIGRFSFYRHPGEGRGLSNPGRAILWEIPAFAGMTVKVMVALLVMTTPVAARPMRIVSLNPCADAVLMHVAEPKQIAAISHYSHDARATSIPLRQALRFPVTSGTAEEVLALRPDLVIAGPHVALPTIHALERQKIALMRLDVAESVEQSKSQISDIAAAIGMPQRGARLNAAIDKALRASAPSDDRLMPALIWQGSGMVPGANTLADELLRRTGFRNMSSAYGLKQWDILPLEHLLARPPRVLFTAGGAAGRSDRMLSHPVIRRLSHRIVISDYAPRLLHCAGPSMIDAVKRLSQVRKSLKTLPPQHASFRRRPESPSVRQDQDLGDPSIRRGVGKKEARPK